MKALIVDDEEPARIEMRRLLSLHPEVKVIGEASDVDTALALTREHRPDIVFLDIQLAGESGFDYVTRVGEPAPRIVFVTAYDRFAMRGFECNALDYLLKPVVPSRLADSLRRLPQSPPRRAGEEDSVFLRGSSVTKFVPWKEICRIESQGNYTVVFLTDGSSTVMLRTLKQWSDLVPEGEFLQIHRSTLIRLGEIREIRLIVGGTRELILADGTALPIGRTYWPRLQKILDLQ